MCLKEFCSCWSPTVEGEGSMDRRPQRQPSPKLKPTESFDPPKKTPAVNDSGVQGAPTSPLHGKPMNGGHEPPSTPPPPAPKETPKPYTPPPAPPKETPKPFTPPPAPPKEPPPPVVSKPIEKVTAASTDGERKGYTTTQRTTSEDVRPSSQLAYHGSTDQEALPKGGGTAVPKNSPANVAAGTTKVQQQPPTKIGHESTAPTGDFTGQTWSAADQV